MPVLQLKRALAGCPDLPALADVTLRNYRGAEDIELWLRLRAEAFADEQPAVGRWERHDFEREFLAQPWWRPERMWFAEVLPERRVVGTVTLAQRGPRTRPQPVVHWLAVLPAWRRRGIARILIAALERECWSAGWRTIALETHSSWLAAVRFYDALGYQSPASTLENGTPFED